MPVESAFPRRQGQSFMGNIHVSDLPEGVHAGVRATGAMNATMLPSENGHRFFEGVLDGVSGRLTLPALKSATIVGYEQSQAQTVCGGRRHPEVLREGRALV